MPLFNGSFAEAARLVREWPGGAEVFAGLDGFVDEIIHIVEKREGLEAENYKRYERIGDFGEAVKQAGGLSCNFEMVPTQVKLGGNGPIYANALLSLGLKVTYCGSIGYPDIHPVFRPMADHPNCRAISAWEPAHTDALEFQDGKLIMGKMKVVYDITWERFKEAVGGIQALAGLISRSRMLGMLNWTMLPFMSGIWEGIINEALPLINIDEPRPFFFFDIADPAKRTDVDIKHALELMGEFNKRFRVILGLNEKESWQIAETLGISEPARMSGRELAEAVYERLDVYCLVIHPTKEAYAVTKDGFAYVKGPYCARPVLTTGAGDNFNAGFCLGQLMGFDAETSLRTGVSASGFYVRNGSSPNLNQLADFMQNIYNEETCPEN